MGGARGRETMTSMFQVSSLRCPGDTQQEIFGKPVGLCLQLSREVDCGVHNRSISLWMYIKSLKVL